ncbi:hypothetical protein Tco_1165528 [Tanacetum coccineum]
MLAELRKMFEKPPAVEIYDLVDTLHSCKQAPGKSVSEHVLEMKGLMDQLHTLGKPYDNDMAVELNQQENPNKDQSFSPLPHDWALEEELPSLFFEEMRAIRKEVLSIVLQVQGFNAERETSLGINICIWALESQAVVEAHRTRGVISKKTDMTLGTGVIGPEWKLVALLKVRRDGINDFDGKRGQCTVYPRVKTEVSPHIHKPVDRELRKLVIKAKCEKAKHTKSKHIRWKNKLRRWGGAIDGHPPNTSVVCVLERAM